MVAAADRHGLDWRLMPVISVLESQGGITACGGNAWGFARCEVEFPSFEAGIPVVAATLASYGPYDAATLLCIWVSGTGCHSHQAIDYTHRAASLYPALGGVLAVPPLPAPDDPLPSLESNVVSAAAPSDSATSTPTPAPPDVPPEPDSPSPTPAGEEPEA